MLSIPFWRCVSIADRGQEVGRLPEVAAGDTRGPCLDLDDVEGPGQVHIPDHAPDPDAKGRYVRFTCAGVVVQKQRLLLTLCIADISKVISFSNLFLSNFLGRKLALPEI